MTGEQAFQWLTGRQPLPGADPQEYQRYATERPTNADQRPARKALRDLEAAITFAVRVAEPPPKNLVRWLRSAGRMVQRYAEALAYEVEQQQVEED